jgi:hypothetical protein
MRAITIKKDILLVTIERHCTFLECKGRVSIGVTRDEAREYHGFECPHCKRWNDDILNERDVPEWWDELNAGIDIS